MYRNGAMKYCTYYIKLKIYMISDLSKQLNVTEVTIRRDLDAFE